MRSRMSLGKAATPAEFNAKMIDRFRASEVGLGGMLERTPLLLLHHTGAKSGVLGVSAIRYLRNDTWRLASLPDKLVDVAMLDDRLWITPRRARCTAETGAADGRPYERKSLSVVSPRRWVWDEES
jgi:hypothetical protein